MNKKELKQMLKPLIKECIKEVIFEDGTLSTIISEVVQGVGQPIVETKQRFPKKQQPQYETDEQAKARLKNKQQKMMESIGADAYNGVNLFEGTTPTTSAKESGRGALSDVDPKDPGVDISSFVGKSSMIWQKMAGKDGK
jgi:Txe/YoeB family toxin of Txe-Axe toxin-antitoxin module